MYCKWKWTFQIAQEVYEFVLASGPLSEHLKVSDVTNLDIVVGVSVGLLWFGLFFWFYFFSLRAIGVFKIQAQAVNPVSLIFLGKTQGPAGLGHWGCLVDAPAEGEWRNQSPSLL